VQHIPRIHIPVTTTVTQKTRIKLLHAKLQSLEKFVRRLMNGEEQHMSNLLKKIADLTSWSRERGVSDGDT